ncbi:MAG TPA: pyridoxamine 5'-phosphate oxidase family protein [Micromonosporaceae bacterium]|nr:pyridoxamine 5'-phosphate oxidase family protein [Micromonosporaceae bacterium]
MADWPTFAITAPALAGAIRRLFHQYGPGFGYLATVRPDGGPRVHPVSPVITDGGLYCFVVSSPKRGDLDRDGRYALHAFPAEDSDDEAYLSGRARPVLDPERHRTVAAACRAAPRVDWRLYEFTVEVAMVSTFQHRNTWPPRRLVWRDPLSRLDADLYVPATLEGVAGT